MSERDWAVNTALESVLTFEREWDEPISCRYELVEAVAAALRQVREADIATMLEYPLLQEFEQYRDMDHVQARLATAIRARGTR